ncbi:hypothetical protein C6569_04995 [Phreatobacter cathodiphilus]|uniref:Uncharacterized protein n=1 Tax=Phreatobacter cathodiphilus TaxID=1868589 RepID=A0A2S0N8I2_9HYPH|nr:hypothetical protein C6569_04995 [Phreatobacter cathodiphilus]
MTGPGRGPGRPTIGPGRGPGRPTIGPGRGPGRPTKGPGPIGRTRRQRGCAGKREQKLPVAPGGGLTPPTTGPGRRQPGAKGFVAQTGRHHDGRMPVAQAGGRPTWRGRHPGAQGR